MTINHTPLKKTALWGTKNRIKFYTDQELDAENGLYNYNARLYDPLIGRFISPDTIVQDSYNPQSLNRYTYCLNNPLIYTDPSGHMSESEETDLILQELYYNTVLSSEADTWSRIKSDYNEYMQGFLDPVAVGAFAEVQAYKKPFNLVQNIGGGGGNGAGAGNKSGVTIEINRTTYTNKSIISEVDVKSTNTNATFSGVALENSNPPNPNLPVPAGQYSAYVTSTNRIQLNNVPNATGIQIHIGNYPSDVTGCFAIGMSSPSPDYVYDSTTAMNNILNIITADGSGDITVIVQ